jgi:hypothetical protein
MYLCCGATDIYLETGESLLIDTEEIMGPHGIETDVHIRRDRITTSGRVIGWRFELLMRAMQKPVQR